MKYAELTAMVERPPWFEDAACRSAAVQEAIAEGRVSFYVSTARRSRRDLRARRALKVCALCPVRVECAEYGAGELFGIWGGTTEAERTSARGVALRARHVA